MTTEQKQSCPLKPIWSDTTSPSAVPGEHYITDYELCSQERVRMVGEVGAGPNGAGRVRRQALGAEGGVGVATDTKTDTQPIRMTCPQCLDAQTTIVVTIEKTTLEHGYPTDQYVEVTYRLYSSETHPRCLCVPSDRQYNDMVTKAIRQTRQTMGI